MVDQDVLEEHAEHLHPRLSTSSFVPVFHRLALYLGRCQEMEAEDPSLRRREMGPLTKPQ